MIAAAIFVALLIILSGLYYAIVYFGGDEATPEEPKEKEVTVDDQISPLENQGLIVEMNRIRHRGLLDQILKIGRNWRNTPQYYYKITIDGLEYVSKDLSGGVLFSGWDTIFMDNRVQKDIEEEQETSTVKISVIEQESIGILGLRSQDVEKELLEVTYNFRTGKWTGDDYFMDDDGYGHYVGDTFEFWFDVYQTDFDADRIPYWAEVNVLGSDPRVDDGVRDPDGDGVPTSWEYRWGYDPFSWDDHEHLDPDVDGIQNVEEYRMEKYFADPFAQDIYIEVDGMEKGGLFDIVHEFYVESGQIVMERFRQHGINVYIDDGWPDGPLNGGGEVLPYYSSLDQDSGIMLQFYKHHFDDGRKGVFRYMIVGSKGGFCIPSTFNRYDTIVINSAPVALLKRQAFTPRAARITLAAAALHELGHSLGVTPWTIEGCDNISFAQGERQKYVDTWGDYYSVMNYYHVWDKGLVDYSTGENGPPYDQNDYEHFYLPTFYIDVDAIEDPELELPGKDRIVDLDIPPLDDTWMIEENLTKEYQSFFAQRCYVENVDCDIRVYVPDNLSETNLNGTIVKVFAKPLVEPTFSQYSLISEATLDETGRIKQYNQQAIIDNLRR